MDKKICGHVISNIGMKKIANEDNYLINNFINEESRSISEDEGCRDTNNKMLYYAAVFDGMGGGSCGQLASKLAAQEFRKVLDKVPATISDKALDELVHKCFLDANRRIVEERRKHSILGTTATLLCIRKKDAKVFHIGDSRAYVLRETGLRQLTKDQTLAALKIEAGFYKADSPEMEKDKNMLTEYLGADETMESIRPLESSWISLKDDATFLLCSDGLYHFCTDEEIAEVLKKDKKPAELADKLVCSSLKKGSDDNITCLVVTVRSK